MSVKYEIGLDRVFIWCPYEDRFKAKQIPYYRWHPAKKCWSYPIKNKILESINEVFNLYIGKVEPEVVKPSPIPELPSLLEYNSAVDPFPHQRYAVTQMFEHERFALLMEMGTGKTKCIVDWYGIAKYKRKLIDGMLVVCPKSVFDSWIEELSKHKLDEYVLLDGTKSQRIRKMDASKINIINYEGMLVLEDELQMFANDRIAIVLDESSKIKSPKASRTKLIVKTFNVNKFKFILTGTPITQSPIDIYTQYKFLDESFIPFQSWYSFRNYYCIMNTGHGKSGSFQQIVGYQNLPELKKKIDAHAYVLKKEDCNLDLPDKLYQIRKLEMKPDMATQYTEMQKNLVLEIGNDKRITASIILVKLLRLQQIISGCWLENSKQNLKLMELLDVVINGSGDQKIIIWCKFIESIKLIFKALSSNNIPSVLFYGEMDNEQRHKAIDKFRNDKQCKVFIGQIQTGGMGLNLQCASMVIYFENSFSLQDRLQSEDRCHRPGQKNNVTYIDLLYKSTIDVDIMRAIKDKKKIADELITSMGIRIKEVLSCKDVFTDKDFIEEKSVSNLH